MSKSIEQEINDLGIGGAYKRGGWEELFVLWKAKLDRGECGDGSEVSRRVRYWFLGKNV